MWENSTLFKIQTSDDATVRVGSQVEIKPDTLYSLEGNSTAVNGSVIIQQPPNATAPTIVLYGPSTINNTDELVSYKSIFAQMVIDCRRL